MKSNLSSLEITYLVRELQFLVGAKLEKIFQTEKPKEDFLFSFHVSNHGKSFLYLSLPNIICLSSFKPSFPQLPPSFCSSLRRKITGAKVTDVSQVGFERIIQIGFLTKHGQSNLIVELLPPGNVVLTLPDEDDKIIAVLHPKIWSDERKILPNKSYVFPKPQIDPRTLSLDDLSSLINSSDKDSIVKSLAIDFSLGGMFAKEVLSSANIDHDISPKDISKEQSKDIFDSLNNLFSRDISAFLIDGNALAFPLVAFPSGESKDSFNDAIASIALSNLELSEDREYNKSSKEALSKVQKVLKAQTSSLAKLEKNQEEKRKKGELIYANYSQIQSIFDELSTLRKTHSWAQIKEHFKSNPLVSSIDEHSGTLTLELDEK